MSLEEKLIQEISGIKNLTIDSLLEALIKTLRQSIYKEFPSANPMSVETSLLIMREYMSDVYIAAGFPKDVLSNYSVDEVSEEEIIKAAEKASILAKAVRRAIAQMNN